MVNYGVAFKLPFTNMQRFAVLFLIAALASLASTTYQIIQKIADGNAARALRLLRHYCLHGLLLSLLK